MKTNKCTLCGATQTLMEHIDKIPKKYQIRFGGKTHTWYSTDHSCPKLKGSLKYLQVLNGL